jgi:hypothetical protein
MREKNYENLFTAEGAASKMFRVGGANSRFGPVDFSQIGKYTSLSDIF